MTKKHEKYLVDTCKGSKYFSLLTYAIKEYMSNEYAHTIAKWYSNHWKIIGEKIGKTESIQGTENQ